MSSGSLGLYILRRALQAIPVVIGIVVLNHSWLMRKPRFDDPPFREYLRSYQRRALIRGKRRVTESLQGSVKQAKQ